MDRTMIKFQNVSYAYPGGNKILDGFNLDIKQGEQVALIGANGAGKSTILKCIVGLLNATGEIEIDGTTLQSKSLSEVREKVGFVLQDSDNQMFMPKVIDDVMFGPINYGVSREEAAKKAENVMERLGISHLKDRHNYKVSCGEKRMAAIASVLSMDPKVMILDEPSAALDPANRRRVINTLNELEVTKIIATHDLDMVLETCDRVVMINKGKIVADGDSFEILSNKELLEANRLELPYCMAGIPKRKKHE